jgi:hypothetical protein
MACQREWCLLRARPRAAHVRAEAGARPPPAPAAAPVGAKLLQQARAPGLSSGAAAGRAAGARTRGVRGWNPRTPATSNAVTYGDPPLPPRPSPPPSPGPRATPTGTMDGERPRSRQATLRGTLAAWQGRRPPGLGRGGRRVGCLASVPVWRQQAPWHVRAHASLPTPSMLHECAGRRTTAPMPGTSTTVSFIGHAGQRGRGIQSRGAALRLAAPQPSRRRRRRHAPVLAPRRLRSRAALRLPTPRLMARRRPAPPR